jgi:hypothetical protein
MSSSGSVKLRYEKCLEVWGDAKAARKDRERQRKEQEDRIKKMAKEFENKEQTEEAKRRILKSANLEITAVDSHHANSKKHPWPFERWDATHGEAVR